MEQQNKLQANNNKMLAYGSYDALQSRYSEASVQKVEQVLEANFPTLFDIHAEFGVEKTKAFIVKELMNYNDFLNIGKKFNASQIVQTADLILMKYSNLSVLDFKLFFQNCRLGVYGQLFDAIDGQLILLWMERYKSERMTAAEHLSIQQHQRRRHEENNPVADGITSQECIDAIYAILNKAKAKANKLPNEEKIIDSSPIKNEINGIVQGWMREFDELHKNQPDNLPGVRFVNVDGKMLTQAEFLEYKFSMHDASAKSGSDFR